jgi:hypothetical protein
VSSTDDIYIHVTEEIQNKTASIFKQALETVIKSNVQKEAN